MRSFANGLMLAIFAGLALSACTEENPAYNPDPLLPGECREGTASTETFESFERPGKLDVLFVVDNSGDVEDLQQAMAFAAAQWLQGLQGDLDINVAVATTDGTVPPRLAPPGTLASGCEGNTTQIARSSQSNFSRLIACNIIQGENGDPFQQTIGVLDGLFFNTSVADLGFFRSDARLLVIALSNEDDCTQVGSISGEGPPRQICADNADKLSLVGDFVDKLSDVSVTPQGFAFVAISGPPSASDTTELRPVCTSSLGASYGAPRLYATTRLLGDRGHFASSCAEDFITVLDDLSDRYAIATQVSLCPAKKLAHEPLSVTGFDSDNEGSPIKLGGAGFQFLGPTAYCPNGELGFNAAALAEVSRIEATYCVE